MLGVYLWRSHFIVLRLLGTWRCSRRSASFGHIYMIEHPFQALMGNAALQKLITSWRKDIAQGSLSCTKHLVRLA